MITLAIDTTAHLCAACIYDSNDDRVLGLVVDDIGRGHAEHLFPIIGRAMDMAGMTYQDIQRLGVCVGPGSFTGLRVGVSAMRGLSLALSLPLVGITVFEALAETASKHEPLLVVLDARRGEIYTQLFDTQGQPAGPPAALSAEASLALAVDSHATLTGSGASILVDLSAESNGTLAVQDNAAAADVAVVARLSARREPDGNPPRPLYLRSPDAKPQTGFALARRATVQ
tara:strand:- start:37280 stop:37966 length:687 start_codon:yes stop_codon:yes gene_type:complete